MKLSVKKFAADKLNFEDLSSSDKSVKIAVNNRSKIEYWFDPKTSTIFGYSRGKVKDPVSEFAIKDQDYLDAVIDMFENNKNIKLV